MTDLAKGSPISLTSNSLIRYQGKFDFINTKENTVGLMDVLMMGTEGRKNGVDEVPPNPSPYDFIVFRGADIKDLQFDVVPAPAAAATNFQDPAVVRSQVTREEKKNQPQSYASRARGEAPPSQKDMFDRFNNDGRGGRGGGGAARGGRGDSRGNFHRDNFGSVDEGYTRDKFSGNNNREDRHPRDDRHNRDDRRGNNYDDRRGGHNNNVRPYEGGSRRGGGGQGYSGGHGGGGGHHTNHGNGGYGNGQSESHTGRDFVVPTGNQREKLEEFDFAKSSEEFEKEKAEFRAKEGNEIKAYNKSSFFDSLSTDKDRQGRMMRGVPRAADSETFGTDMVGAMQGFRSGRGGRGGRGQYNRY